MEDRQAKKISIKQVLVLQWVVLIYTLATVAAKFASGHDFMSFGFIGFYGIEILVLGLYAILWQQLIKKVDLSVAYANKAFGIFWSLIWAVLFFKETVTIKNVIGVCIVFAGVMVVNSDGNK